MSIYKTITVDASLSKNLSASADLVTPVEHIWVKDYNELSNKPQINTVELIGNKSLPEIGVDSISNSDIEDLLK